MVRATIFAQADTGLDIIYAIVPFVFLALGVRSQPMIIPHDPVEYMSNMFPMLHAHFVIATLERAADEVRALQKVGVRGIEEVAVEHSHAAINPVCEDHVEPAVKKASSYESTADDGTSKMRFPARGKVVYAALVAACAIAWSVAYCAAGPEAQWMAAATFVATSLALPLGARRAGRPSFSVWRPACVFGVCYVLLFILEL